MKNLASMLLVCVLAVGCGGGGGGDGSGVDQGKAVTEMSASELTQFCEWGIDTLGGEGHTVQCTDFEFDAGTVAECEMDVGGLPEACSGLTVGEIETCIEAIGADPCGTFEDAPPECDEYFTCALSAVR